MMTRAEQLIDLARKKFDLSAPERKLLQKVAEGKAADYSAADEALNDPATAAGGEQNRMVAAGFIGWVWNEPGGGEVLKHLGVDGVGAKIEG